MERSTLSSGCVREVFAASHAVPAIWPTTATSSPHRNGDDSRIYGDIVDALGCYGGESFCRLPPETCAGEKPAGCIGGSGVITAWLCQVAMLFLFRSLLRRGRCWFAQR